MAMSPSPKATICTMLSRPRRAILTIPKRQLTKALNEWLGRGLRIEYRQRILCCHCGSQTPRSYGGGYCYPCFRSLARCDLCVVSPARCHYHLGTCREPAWGEAFCMQPHVVYLANSSGPKVGITGADGAVSRWLDQGASQGLVIARTASRHLAGVVEAQLAQLISDRTDWRLLLQGDRPPVDLPALRDRLMERLGRLPEGVAWQTAEPVVTLSYPVLAYPRQLLRLRLDRHPVVAGRLLGAKGQYLLFEHGVFNVRWHRAFEVSVGVAGDGETLAVEPADAVPDDSQMELFT
jgi:hypothetical protein